MGEQKRRTDKKKALLAVALTVMLLAGTAYLARGWIRGPLVAWYAERVYLPKVEQTFEQTFKEVNYTLEPFALTFNEHRSATVHDAVAKCYDPMYKGLGLSTYCFKAYVNDSPGPEITDAYRELWRAESPALEEYLLADGWTKTWDVTQHIDELLVRDDIASAQVDYEKRRDKINCRLSISYEAADKEFGAQQFCSRDLGLFGGIY